MCGKQNIALRGHRDDDKCRSNPGNFKALLKFRVESGYLILKEHFKSCPKNATFSSKTIQNELIEVTGVYGYGKQFWMKLEMPVSSLYWLMRLPMCLIQNS